MVNRERLFNVDNIVQASSSRYLFHDALLKFLSSPLKLRDFVIFRVSFNLSLACCWIKSTRIVVGHLVLVLAVVLFSFVSDGPEVLVAESVIISVDEVFILVNIFLLHRDLTDLLCCDQTEVFTT